MQVRLPTTRAWPLGQPAGGLPERGALAGLWLGAKNRTGLPPSGYRRCWLYHLAMKPFYHCTPQIWDERATYWLSGLWRLWLRANLRSPHCPKFDVAQAIMGFATEIFQKAEQTDALKVVDCPNSHPTSYYGFWQRECDLWCPGEKVPIPRWMFARMNREIDRADLIIVQSKFSKESMVANGVPEEKVLVNPMGVDTSIFTERTEVPQKIRFISVGTICLRKG